MPLFFYLMVHEILAAVVRKKYPIENVNVKKQLFRGTISLEKDYLCT